MQTFLSEDGIVTSDENGSSAPDRGKQDVLDASLRDRVNHAMADLKRSLDAAVAQPTSENLDQLREATDRVMRASARVLIELGRRGDHGDNTKGSR